MAVAAPQNQAQAQRVLVEIVIYAPIVCSARAAPPHATTIVIMATTGAPGTILVTGGSSGLGEATARELAGAGYNVVVRTALPSATRGEDLQRASTHTLTTAHCCVADCRPER